MSAYNYDELTASWEGEDRLANGTATDSECIVSTDSNSLVTGLAVTELVALYLASGFYLTTFVHLALVQKFETMFSFIQCQVSYNR